MKTLLLLGLASWCVSAQPISIGVKAGVPITDVIETGTGGLGILGSFYAPNNHRYLVGGTIQLNLPARFSIEVDGLYRRVGFQQNQFTGGPTFSSTPTTANSWEFPVLGKLALLPGPIRPFVDAGASFRCITGAQQAGSATVPELAKEFTAGLTFGGGIELKLRRLRISPELRYTHWGSESFHDPANSLLHTNLNQGDFMLGLTF